MQKGHLKCSTVSPYRAKPCMSYLARVRDSLSPYFGILSARTLVFPFSTIMSYTCFTHFIQLGDKHYVDKYLVLSSIVPEGYAEGYMRGSVDATTVLNEWLGKKTFIWLSGSIQATGTCWTPPPNVVIDAEYIRFDDTS